MMRFSVVIPTLNEEQYLRACLEHLRKAGYWMEVIVVDGGSQDRTREIALEQGSTVIVSAPGRGIQQNAGARVATGDALIFLHADTLLPADAFDVLEKAFLDEEVQVGTFRSVFDSDSPLLRFYSYFTRFDSPLSSFGDQCIAIRKSFFVALGGFPDWPLFEDVQLLQVARRRTSIHKFPLAVTTSARKFVLYGTIRHQLWNALYLLLFFAGYSPYRLAVWYERRRIHHPGAPLAVLPALRHNAVRPEVTIR